MSSPAEGLVRFDEIHALGDFLKEALESLADEVRDEFEEDLSLGVAGSPESLLQGVLAETLRDSYAGVSLAKKVVAELESRGWGMPVPGKSGRAE